MNPFQALGRIFRKDDPSRVLIAATNSGPVAHMPRDYKSFSEEGFAKCITVFKAVSLVAGNAGSIRWTLSKKAKGPRSRPEEIFNHSFLDLMTRPNPMQGGKAFMGAVHAFRLISGNSYISADGPKAGMLTDIRELWTVRPDRMTIQVGPRGYPLGFIYTLNGKQIVYPVDQVKLTSTILHLKTFNPTDDWYGLSPMEAGAYGIDQHNSANKWNLSLLQNSARPSGMLVAQVGPNSTGMLTDEQFLRLKEEIEHNYTGSRNAGRPMVLEGGLDWKQISYTNQQMEFLENKNTSARDIASAFGVPSQLLGIPGDSTYANYSEARMALYEETILPAMDYVRDEFNNWIVPTFGDGLVADYDKDEIHALAPRRSQIWDKVSSASFLTENEKRDAVGYEPVEEGDVIMISSTMIPLEDAISKGEQDEKGDQSGGDLGDDGSDDSSEPEDDAEDGTSKGLFEAKLINLKDDRSKLREWRGQNRLRKRFEKRLQRQAHATLEVEAVKVAHVIHGLDAEHAKMAAAREIDANKGQWKLVLTANLQATSRAFKERFSKAAKNFPGAVERKENDSQFDAVMKEWIQNHVGERIKDIPETTKKRVIEAIRDAQQEAYDAGTPLNSFSDAVKAAYDGFSESRAISIARTETGTAANVSLVEAAKSADIPGLVKEWLATNDDRTRPDHYDMNGETVELDAKFNVGGSMLEQPGDPNGSAAEIINCRCGIAFRKL